MTNYTILQPVTLAEHCYLVEVLFWRAFGRIPLHYSFDGEPLRFSREERNSYVAPNLEGELLSEEECLYAGIPFDPRMKALVEDMATCHPDQYAQMLRMAESFSLKAPEASARIRADIAESELYHIEVADWLPQLAEYIDQFKNEVCLDLRRGDLTSYATEVSAKTRDEIEEQFEAGEIEHDELDVAPVPQECWVSGNVNWDESTILGRARSFIWIHLTVEEVLNRYPPEVLVDPTKTFPIGSSVALVGASNAGNQHSNSKRGRPPLPWDAFHVQVAKLYLDGAMPDKKEAAIAQLQEWFCQNTGKTVSRSAIGQKLKPYFDEFGIKDRK